MDNSRIKSWKSLAEIFLKENKRIYIKDFNGDYYFADIIFVGEETLTIECFAPISRIGKKFTLYWVSIERFDEYKEQT
jgi:hypothetical protein